MGNSSSQPSYYSTKQALEVLGPETFHRLKDQLQKELGRYVDFNFFQRSLQSRFRKMQRNLCEILYNGFATDKFAKVDVSDFICGLAACFGDDKMMKLRFLFRVYDVNSQGMLDAAIVEKVMSVAYGGSVDQAAINHYIQSFFPSSNQVLTPLEFETCATTHGIDLLEGWVTTVLRVFVAKPSQLLLSLYRRYSIEQEIELLMERYKVSKVTIDQLYQIFHSRILSSSAQTELDLDTWLTWTADFLPRLLAKHMYIIQTSAYKPKWRFVDFAQFCVLYGLSTIDKIVEHLCVQFQQKIQNDSLAELDDNSKSDEKLQSECLLTISYMRKTVEVLSLKEYRNDANLSDATINVSLTIEDLLMELETEMMNTPSMSWMHKYIEMLYNYSNALPGISHLRLTACCLFGIRPPSLELEKQYIVELQLRKNFSSTKDPYGPPGTEWCILSAAWMRDWQMHVGRIADDNEAQNADLPPIDNWSVLRKGVRTRQLMHGCSPGNLIEVVPFEVFATFQFWYGGGPKIVRSVILSETGQTILELYPLQLHIQFCDDAGNLQSKSTMEVLFSRSKTISEVVKELCISKNIDDETKARIWNLASQSIESQFVLQPDITLGKANIQDGQSLLLEISLDDGSWPRSQLQNKVVSSTANRQKDAGGDGGNKSPLSENGDLNSIFVNHGRVGLDNLGNTCYMNSSLQALLHCPPLAEYFLKKIYLRDVNATSKHGYNGKLAQTFAKLNAQLWTKKEETGIGIFKSSNLSISPAKFRKDIAVFAEQFGGDEQHDAQEFLQFLLDGLSEDLNLVHDKPYIENPDSDDRPDHELADIWWENHLKRELSLVQSLFAGQFKSIMHCTSCNYSSARFEPFSFLSVPLPDDELIVMNVHMVLLDQVIPTLCSVLVKKSQKLLDVAQQLQSYISKSENEDDTYFIVAELQQSILYNFISIDTRIESIRYSDKLFFYQVHKFNSSCEDNRNNSPPPDTVAGDRLKRFSYMPNDTVVLYQRKLIHIVEDGMNFFRMEPFGFPIITTVPEKVTTKTLYEIAYRRVNNYFKSQEAPQVNSSENESTRRSSGNKVGFYKYLRNPTSGNGSPLNQSTSIKFISTEEAITGEISKEGFVLRTVNQNGDFCSRCHWLSQCEGCILPNSDDVPVDLSECCYFSIDWHIVVCNEALDNARVNETAEHTSIKQYQSYQNQSLSLHRCIEKFMEKEKLDDIVCPKCKHDHCLYKTFSIWRLPPILMIQLKRFQFNNYSRRKLTNLVHFPVDKPLSMVPFLTSQLQSSKDAKPLSTDTSSSGVDCDINVSESSDDRTLASTSYELYGVVHHVGAMGGGHYVSTIRDESEYLHSLLKKNDVSSEVPTDTTTDELQKSSSASSWWCFNDSLVMPARSNEICCSAAYVLFYIRQDMYHHSVEELHKLLHESKRIFVQENTPDSNREGEDTRENCTETTKVANSKRFPIIDAETMMQTGYRSHEGSFVQPNCTIQ